MKNSLCLICRADGKKCDLAVHVKDARNEERERALYLVQVEANKYPRDSEAHEAILAALHSLEWSHR